MVPGIFKIALLSRDRYVFVWQALELLNVSNTLNLKQIFWKTGTFFKKPEYLFWKLDLHLKIFPFKTAVSEANVTK